MASIEYCEQEGKKRQLEEKIGDIQYL